MAAVLELAWLWRKASGSAMGFGPMNPQPLSLFLKLVALHPKPLAHTLQLPGTVNIDELISFPCSTVLA